MPCFSALQAYKLIGRKSSTGKSIIEFSKPKFSPSIELELPCGQCIGCRLERSRQWAMRCVHEASLHEDNCFITLTFDNEHLDKRENPFSIDVRDFQLFMKRFRKRYNTKIRYFHCGEYGEQYGRPHYHACIFGFDFKDKKIYTYRNGIPLYTSDSLSELWPFGFSSLGAVTFDSAAYVARYIMKKLHGDHYHEFLKFVVLGRELNIVDKNIGTVLLTRLQEYVTMSRRPGIAKEWFDRNGS